MRLNDAELILSGQGVLLEGCRVPVVQDSHLAALVKQHPRCQRMAYVTAEGDESRLPDVCAAWSNIALDSATVERTAARRCRNLFTSLVTLAKSSQWYMVPQDLAGRTFKGVCIVGAGCSLDRDIEEVELWRRRGVLIAATNTASTVIEPDVVGYLESNDFTHTIRPGVPVLSDTTTWPVPGEHAWFQSLDPAFDDWAIHQRLMPIEVGPSVTTALMSWAVAVGFKQIVLVGVDLGGIYSQHSPYAARVRQVQPVMLPRVGGGECESNIIFADELAWIERYAERADGIRFVDTAFATSKRGFDNVRASAVEFSEQVNPGDQSFLINDGEVGQWLESTREGLVSLREAAARRDHWEVRHGLRRHLFMDAMLYADLLRMGEFDRPVDRMHYMLDCIIARATEVLTWF